jgi:hypothetical protein
MRTLLLNFILVFFLLFLEHALSSQARIHCFFVPHLAFQQTKKAFRRLLFGLLLQTRQGTGIDHHQIKILDACLFAEYLLFFKRVLRSDFYRSDA